MSLPEPTPLPELADLEHFAFFFDFDGTLADIAERPEEVKVTEATREALAALLASSGSAVAIITGRDIASIDHFLAPVRLPIAGVHGLTRRDANGQLHEPEFDGGPIEAIAEALKRFAERQAGLLVERKFGAVALHYRQRPELELECLEAMERAANGYPAITLRRGKMVIEAVGHAGNKGAAIGSFLQEAPFLGRTPVFAGDDLTDEDGFAYVNGRKGVSIKVGTGATGATFRVEDREALLAWLGSIIGKTTGRDGS
jgi:trehalose 6-phosphate phosphatase